MISLNKLLKNSYQEYRSIVITFCLFSTANFFIFNYVFYVSRSHSNVESNLRLVTIILTAVFFLIEIQSKSNKPFKYQHIFWFILITLSIPFFATFNFLYYEASSNWLLNSILGLFWLTLLCDYKVFFISLTLGMSSGSIFFHYYDGNLVELNQDNTINLAISSIWVVLLVMVFSRKKDLEQKNIKLIETEAFNKQINQYSKELEQALEVKTEFLNNLNHEIRTPVHGFTVLSEGLVEHWEILEAEKKLQLAKEISTSAKRLAYLVGSILDLSKYNDDKMVMSFRKIHLNEIIENLIEEAKLLYIKNKEIKFIFKPEQEIFIHADHERIVQLFRNLIKNAVTYSNSKGKITISTSKKAKYYYIKIADQGVGIPKNELDEIFKPFIQSSRTKTKAGGTGMGLAIAYQIVKKHNGHIWAKNNSPKGAVFHIKLPSVNLQN